MRNREMKGARKFCGSIRGLRSKRIKYFFVRSFYDEANTAVAVLASAHPWLFNSYRISDFSRKRAADGVHECPAVKDPANDDGMRALLQR